MKHEPGTDNRRNVLIDSSSTIILFKTGMLGIVNIYYNIIMTESVFNELIQGSHAGSVEIKQFAEQNSVRIISAETIRGWIAGCHISIKSLDKGEEDTIVAYLHGEGDFIIIDDGKGAGYCKKQDIPYINALLVPRILRIAGIISDVECEYIMCTIIEFGRYSEKIIEFARSCSNVKLNYFV